MRTKSKLVRQNPPADFDEVKRRFIRQNRELAKNNSSQSLKIRNLELELSRLLADNLELRNHVLRVQNELYTAQSKASSAAAKKVKEELQAKIAELSGIVNDIEDAGEDAADRRISQGERKPLEGNWRERQPLAELMRDSQMPTIMEDKLYPRRTLGADEIQAIRLSDHSSNESPDLGPPPVVHFDDEEPTKYTSPLTYKASPDHEARIEEDIIPASLSVNLETRRKRRDGQPRLEIRRRSLLPQSPCKSDGEPSTILRTGAKRKLADRETEKTIRPPSKGDFTFSRKVSSDDSKIQGEDGSGDPVAAKLPETLPPSPLKATRKVLGDKSVNMSPKKVTPLLEPADKEKLCKPDASGFTGNREVPSTRRRRISSIPLPLPQDEVQETAEVAPPSAAPTTTAPKTPAAPDLFSPTRSEPSAKPESRGDTPPPADLSTLSASTDGAARPPRRARAAVNYAEPSLVSKMRRPDRKLVDAVTGVQDHRRVMSAPIETEALSQAKVVKQEPEEEEDGAWKDLPSVRRLETGSPLQQWSQSPPVPLSAREANSKIEALASDKPLASSATISALIAGNRKRRQSTQQTLGTDLATTTTKLEELELYDFKSSSSSPVVTEAAPPAAPPVSRSHRRHSSMPKDHIPGDRSAPAGADGKARLGTGLPAGRSERAASRRRSMMV